MNGTFLVPANSKKSLLILGLFNSFDLTLFGTGVFFTIIMMIALPVEIFSWAVISMLPVCVTGLLVFPLPNYHNVLTAIISIIKFFTGRQRYVWKGWCARDEFKETSKK